MEEVEETIDPALILIIAFAVLVVILLAIHFYPTIEGGWMFGLVDFIKKLSS